MVVTASILWFADRFASLSQIASDPNLQLDLSFHLYVTCPCEPADLPVIRNSHVHQTKVNLADILHGLIDGLPLDGFGGGLGVAASGPQSLTTAMRNAVASLRIGQAKRLGGVELHTEAYAL